MFLSNKHTTTLGFLSSKHRKNSESPSTTSLISTQASKRSPNNAYHNPPEASTTAQVYTPESAPRYHTPS